MLTGTDRGIALVGEIFGRLAGNVNPICEIIYFCGRQKALEVPEYIDLPEVIKKLIHCEHHAVFLSTPR